TETVAAVLPLGQDEEFPCAYRLRFFDPFLTNDHKRETEVTSSRGHGRHEDHSARPSRVTRASDGAQLVPLVAPHDPDRAEVNQRLLIDPAADHAAAIRCGAHVPSRRSGTPGPYRI